ncbi:MAG: hypothetical protein AAF581_19435 [Planctomycetota bacterium]
MGLAIVVGAFADAAEDPEFADDLRESFHRLNTVLVRNGLEQHCEPEATEYLQSRAGLESFPYSFLHYLRRAYARVAADPDFVAEPLPADADPGEDTAVAHEYERAASHLLCHSDCEGYYVPQDFTDVVFCDEEEAPGGMIGSSYRLRDELLEVAPALGIQIEGGLVSDSEVERINELSYEDEGLFRELTVWITLFEAARLSIEHNAAVVFS